MLIFPLINDTSRKIIHIDMDAFYAAVEERDHPELQGKPIVIAKDPRTTGWRGVVSTCNYEARKYGIHSAMSAKEAYDLCPHAIFISGNHARYKAIGQEIREIFKRYTDLVEPVSIDEACLDVTENKLQSKSAVKIAKMIQYDIWHELHLTCSAGVSYNKFLAKLASDFQKPRGLTLLLPEDVPSFLETLPIEKFHGVGKKSVEKLHDMGIFTGKDLLEISESKLIDQFGRFGFDLYRKARGISNSPVKPNRIRKSIGSEHTYAKLLYQEADIKAEIAKQANRVGNLLASNKKLAKTIVLKVRYADFTTLTKRTSLPDLTRDSRVINQTAQVLFDSLDENSTGIRLLGVTVTGLEDKRDNICLDI
ncbi:DNA polymerase IV [Streptococcus phocae subsp. salmonis]|uniref:DNA polymerase IV n=1 Tax=Streptococcus phocae TaxID=119224 RepID=UPI000531334C|nr:DNA polymerase IV [Streptococcus phocae]KGR73372.1 DNA polymerase IV [Streptococcus phocae subsp. salmonis]